MIDHSTRVAFVALGAALLAGCSSSDSGGQAPLESGACPTFISDARGANNAFAMFNGFLSGDGAGSDGLAQFATVCLRIADVPQELRITVLGARPAVGVMYGVTSDPKASNVAVVEYAEGNSGTKVWAGTSGVVKVDSVARESIGFSFSQVRMEPEAGKPANTATGSFALSGTQRADDFLGFVP
jgi:hypothetical protein